MNPKHAPLWCSAPWAVSGDEHFVCNEWFGRSLHISYPIQPGLLRTPTLLSPFDDSYRCLKEINYPRSFSTSSSSVVWLLSVLACPTSVRVQSQRTLPHSSCLLLRPYSRLFSEHRRTVTPRVTTHGMCNPFRKVVDEFSYTPGQFYTEPTHRFCGICHHAHVPTAYILRSLRVSNSLPRSIDRERPEMIRMRSSEFLFVGV